MRGFKFTRRAGFGVAGEDRGLIQRAGLHGGTGLPVRRVLYGSSGSRRDARQRGHGKRVRIPVRPGCRVVRLRRGLRGVRRAHPGGHRRTGPGDLGRAYD